MSDVAIKVENLSKYYRLGVINSGTLGRDLQSWLWKKMGKEDPNKKIDAHGDDADGFWALKDLNFEIKKGERVGIIGKNGAGKSTLLKMLSQISAPTEGRIYINGKVASLLEVGTGFNQELTGRENIYMNGAILGMKKQEIDAKIDEIIVFSEIERYIDTPVKRYSSGMYVRLAFAVAAHLDSDILIADEVLAVGDINFQKKALGKMNDLSSRQGKTILFVSHNIGAVKQLCNRGIVLEKGIVRKDDTCEECSNFYMYNSENKIDLAKCANEYFDVLDFYLEDSDRNRRNNFRNDEEMFVCIRINIKKLCDILTIGYGLYIDDNTPMYWSYPHDLNAENNMLKLGVNIMKCPIPLHFVNSGMYFVKLIGSLHFKEWLVSPDDCIQIKLDIDGGLSESPFYVLKRPGFNAPLLKWEISKEK